MENIKKEINKLKKEIEISNTLKQKEDAIRENRSRRNYYIHTLICGDKKQTIDEMRKELDTNCPEIEITEAEEINLYNSIELSRIKKEMLYNNINILIINKYNNDIIEILKKYQNKKIGEKTADKIETEIQNLIKKDFCNYTIYIHLMIDRNELSVELRKNADQMYRDSYKFEYTFFQYNNSYRNAIGYTIYIKQGYQQGTRARSYATDEDEKITYNYIENVTTAAKKIIKESQKNKKEIELLKKKLHGIYNNNNEMLKNNGLTGDLYEQYKIKDTLTIY